VTDGWDLAGAIEHHPDVDKVRKMVEATRASMGTDRDFEGLVVKALRERHGDEIIGNSEVVLALVSWAMLHLCEEAEREATAP
jgi:hypothetical protein